MLSIQSPLVPFQTGEPVGPEILVILAIIAVSVAGMWKTFEKAGKPGWAAIVPIYNLYVLIKISGNAGWWLLLLFIPLINVLVQAKISIDIADKFGQGILFGLGLWLFSIVFFPLLGFGDYQYRGSGRGPDSAL